MVYIDTVTLAATGTAQQLRTTHLSCNWVTLQADPDNAANIYHGPSNVTSSNGQIIAAGQGGGSPQYPPMSDISPYDLSRIYVTGTQNDIVRIMYGVR